MSSHLVRRYLLPTLVVLLVAACGGGGGGDSAVQTPTRQDASNTPNSPPIQPTTGAATLSWMPPTENTDGSTLTNLAGYQVLYGRSPEELDQSVTLNNPSLSSYVVENLSSGTWYFTVVALNSSGESSPLSNLASKTIG